MKTVIFTLLILFGFSSCKKEDKATSYFTTTSNGVKNGGVQLIEITTNNKKFKVWTKRIGNNPKVKLLLLNGEIGRAHV